MKLNSILSVILACAVSSCTSMQDAGQTAGVVVFGAALITLIPVSPLIAGYHAASGKQESEEKSRNEWKAILDPVYQKRTTMLKSRNPVTDADIVYKESGLVFLTSQPEGVYYPGLNSKTDMLPEHESNQRAVSKSSLAKFLAKLMDKDPNHPAWSRTGYSSQVYNDFIRAGGQYMEQFNQTMYARRQKLSVADVK